MVILFINVCLTVVAAFTRVNQQRQFFLKTDCDIEKNIISPWTVTDRHRSHTR